MRLSIFLAGIRFEGWATLYNSLVGSTALIDYEFIIVSPYDRPSNLTSPNVRVIKDYGCPTRCYQIGLLHSTGEYVVWVGDDGTFSPTGAIDKALESIPKHKKGVVAFPYSEGNPKQLKESWWHLGSHKMLKNIKTIPNHFFLVMSGLMRRDYLMELGGWDCIFEHSALPCVDLSVRMQRDGAEVILGERIQDLDFQKGPKGDHGPIYSAHKQDKGRILTIYNGKNSENRTKININNWKQAPGIWPRRWPEGIK